MNIVLFGGAFDPPHLGHQSIAEELLRQNIADEVWFVPVGVHDFDKNMSSSLHRTAMLEMILTDSRMKIEKHELEVGGVGYTHETLDALSQKYPEHTFSWIIGSDNLKEFHTWKDSRGNTYEDMLRDYRFYVYPRAGFPLEPLYPNMVSLQEVEEWQFSSTEVRQRAKDGRSLSGWVNDGVAQYIAKYALYLS